MTAVDIDDVEAGRTGLLRRFDPVVLDTANIVELHRLGDVERMLVARKLGRPDRRPARSAPLRMDSRVRQFDAGEGAVGVCSGDHEREVCKVTVIEELRRDIRRLVGVGRYGGVLGADSTPASLRLCRAV